MKGNGMKGNSRFDQLLVLAGRGLAIFALSLICQAPAVRAQSATATLSGTVVDEAGAVVPDVRVTALNTSTGAERRATTNNDGYFIIPLLPPATYQVTAERVGFARAEFRQVALAVSEQLALRIQLKVGKTVAETVEIQATAPVNSVDATLGNTFNELQVRQLPLEGRNVVGLLSLQPGVTFFGSVDQQGNTTDYRNGSVNGGKSDQANVTLDGVDVNDQLDGLAFTSVLRLTLDSVQEFRVTTTNPNADQGRSSGAQVSLVTKSGANKLHGSLYEYHRNTVTTANDFFNNKSGVERPALIRNVFGGSVGGPLVKNRAFFFLNYEGRRDARAENVVRAVPSADMRNGILSYVNNQGQVVRLLPEDVKKLDPAGIGPNQASLAVFKQFPLPNDTTVGDGINTFGFRFASPIRLKFDTYIARFDYNLTGDGKHTLFWRGNLQNDHSNREQQFPGAPPNFTDLANSKGFALGYTAALGPNLTNTFRWGYTRQGVESAGASLAPRLAIGITDLQGYTRSSGRIIPVHNLIDDVVWTRGSHTLSLGGNLRFIRNDSFNLANSFSEAQVGIAWLIGQGKDLQPTDIGPGGAAFRGAITAVLGLFSRGLARYNYDQTGKVLPQGIPVKRRFGADEYEGYAQDSWRLRPNLNLILGLRYALFSPPFETNGLQVSPSFSLGRWFELRGVNGSKGIPSNAAPRVTVDLAGPVNGKPSYYAWDKNNFAPRLALAYSPGFNNGWLKRVFGGPGRTSLRSGFGIVYDHLGSALAATMDRVGSFGLSTVISNPAGSVSPKTAPRFNGFGQLPTGLLPPPPPGGFPFTPPGAGQKGGFAISYSIDDTIRTPYSMAFNFSLQRELPKQLTFEAAYVGRLSRKLLVPGDLAMPVDLFDPASGDTYFNAAAKLVGLFDQGTPLTAVPKIPYWENLYPAIAANPQAMIKVLNDQYGYEFAPGTVLSATQVMYLIYNEVYGPDYTTALLDIDADLNCGSLSEGSFPCSKFGAYTFFNDQFSSLQALRSLMPTDYHALQVLVRKRFGQGLQFDFNYTLSKAFDWASRPERNSFQFNDALLVNSWSPRQKKAVSDFDVRHSVNANYIFELPFGRGKYLAKDLPGWADQVLGGWQWSGIFRWTSGLPISVRNGDFYPTNWDQEGNATRIAPVRTATTRNAPSVLSTAAPGVNLFPDPAAARKAYRFTVPGQSGTRNDLRGDGYFALDMGLAKSFRLTEQHRLQFRWEVFNVTNSVRFDVKSALIRLGRDEANFGKYSSTLTSPRVMQFGLRYEF